MEDKNITRVRSLFEQSLPLFNALGDPVRQQLLLAMVNETHKSVGQLTAGTNLSRPTVSFHLKVLKEAGIVASRKEGRNVYYYPLLGQYFSILRELIYQVDKTVKEAKR